MADILDRSSKNVMFALQQTNVKRQVSINRLSTDILSMIFYFVHENVADDDPENEHPIPLLLFRSALTLSHVCRQFRSVALALPKLWSTISNLQNPNSVKHSILRSRDSSFHVTLKLTVNTLLLPHGEKPTGKPGKKDAACIKKIKEQTSRWQSFDLALHIPHDAEDDLDHILPGFVGSFKNLKLDTLEKLTVKIDGWFSGSPGNNAKVNKMFSSWHLPSLQHCILIDFVPSIPISKSISVLDITITDGSYTEDSLLVDDLMKFINQHPNLLELYLNIWDDAFDVQETGTVKLNTSLLRKVRIRAVVGDALESILCILRAFSLVPLKDVTLEFDLLHLFELQRTTGHQEMHVETLQEQLSECVEELAMHHTSLKSFTLRIGRKALPDAFSKCHILDFVFRRLGHLQHLSISAPDFPPPLIDTNCDIALRSLELDKCLKFSNTFFTDFFETLKRKGALDQFERLQVEGCEELERSVALRYLPQGKVAWDCSRQVLGNVFDCHTRGT